MRTRVAVVLFVVLAATGVVPEADSATPSKPVPQVVTGRCIRVVDGDTIEVEAQSQTVKVRLQGIDSPEKDQPGGAEATEYTRSLVEGSVVVVRVTRVEQYDRLEGRVFRGVSDVGLRIVEMGHAWHAPQYSSDRNLAEAEKEAQVARRGLWRDPSPVPPWEWRGKAREEAKQTEVPRIVMVGRPPTPVRDQRRPMDGSPGRQQARGRNTGEQPPRPGAAPCQPQASASVLNIYGCGNDHYCASAEVLPNECCWAGNVTVTLYYRDRSGPGLALSRDWAQGWSIAQGATGARVEVDTSVYTRIYEVTGAEARATCSPR